MKLKRCIALILSAMLIALCVSACGGSDTKQQSTDSAPANAPAADEQTEAPAPQDNHDGMVQFNLIKTITTSSPLNSDGDKVGVVTRDEFGNPIGVTESNSIRKDFKAKVTDERDTAHKYTSTLNEEGDQYVQYIFGADGKLEQIIYKSSSSQLTFTYAPTGGPAEGAAYLVEYISSSKNEKDYYNDKFQLLYHEDYSGGSVSGWNRYYYKEDGKVDKRDTYGRRGEETDVYCEAGRHLTRNTKGEVITECTVEKDASGRIVKENHGAKIYTYEYSADGSLAAMGFYQDADKGEVGSTTTYRADGSVDTDYSYQVGYPGTKVEQTLAYEPFYVLDDDLLIAFLSVIDEYWRGNNLVCFGEYCSLETHSYR